MGWLYEYIDPAKLLLMKSIRGRLRWRLTVIGYRLGRKTCGVRTDSVEMKS